MKKMMQRFFAAISKVELENQFQRICLHQNTRSQETQLLLTHTYKAMLRSGVKPIPRFSEVGFRCFSQFEEDGILLYIFSLIGTSNKVAVEIAAGDGRECNTANLIINHGWTGLLMDGDKRNVEKGRAFFASHKDVFLWPPRFIHEWVTRENINMIIEKEGVRGEIDLLSIDIDGMDYWIWKALNVISPRVVVCETHNVIPPELSLAAPYDPDFKIKTPDFCGASLAAMTKLAVEKGYRLVGSHRYGFNAFFIRNDIAADIFPAVSVESCVRDPYSEKSRSERWQKVKHCAWQEI